MRGRRTKVEPPYALYLNCDPHKVIPELFHLLAQPLTSLNCCLSWFTRKPRQINRLSIKKLLQQVETITWITNSIRVLIDATETPSNIQTCDVARSLAEPVDELLPVAAAKNIGLRLTADDRLPIQLDQERLRLAIFYLLDFALNVAREGTTIFIKTQVTRDGGVLTVQLVPSKYIRERPSQDTVLQETEDLRRRIPLSLAQAILKTAEATFHQHRTSKRLVLQFRFPNAIRETGQPLTPPLSRPA